MKFIRWWNYFMFSRRFNYFDVISILIITGIAIANSYWWFLLYIPTTFISIFMEQFIKND